MHHGVKPAVQQPAPGLRQWRCGAPRVTLPSGPHVKHWIQLRSALKAPTWPCRVTLKARCVPHFPHVLAATLPTPTEKPNEPVVVLFTRLPPEVIRPHLINPPRAGAGAGAGGTELSATVRSGPHS